ncbi:class I SAM-dependent DNA methyltransferase [Labrys portucalensis]|uniref:site-specific DNA-methyltransferase (adenine-specific) n=1 Tax=Labrys neptuniae TaxID=376174 RepID=A0ABV6ZKB8_9HYPH
MTGEVAQSWAERFGLATAPLFERGETDRPQDHTVLLDGGFGSFAMSETEEPIWRDPQIASWAWSSNLPHHVTVSDTVVAVRRWDSPRAEEFSRTSIETQIEPFYEYLITDRVRSTRRVVDHVLQLFKGVRSLVADAGMQDERSIDVFLAFLGTLIEREKEADGVYETRTAAELLRALPPGGLDALMREIDQRTSLQAFRLFPSLAVRHAGSDIFQEAHFELIRTPGVDLFGYSGLAESRAVTRGGAHFTPAPLARSIAENSLAQIKNLHGRQELTVLDPACGSGAFLQEAVRTLRRMGYAGRLRLIGRDISPAAIAMARFVVNHTVVDWSPDGGVVVDVEAADSLEVPLPAADVVVMNPPFMAWSALEPQQRDQVRTVLGARQQGRADLSMAFVTRALDVLNDGGVLGALLPASLLTLQAAQEWRRDIIERGELRLLASLGEYGLFAHALVQVSAVVVSKPGGAEDRSGLFRAIVSTNSADATGNALRMLRRMPEQDQAESPDGSWRIFQLPVDKLQTRPTWRITSPKMEAALSRLLEAGASAMVDLFEVRQGVRTGDNKAFLLDQVQYNALPPRERRFFRRAIMNSSIQDGKIKETFWVFYPYGDPELALIDENALRDSVPTFFRKNLEPRRASLSTRTSVGNNLNWWDLSRSRVSWALDERPRIISKYFGGTGGFAIDLRAEYITVQGFAWLPKWEDETSGEDEIEVLPSIDLICAYSALMNSGKFAKVLEFYSPHVAGGQFDLSPRYVDNVVVPNLVELARDQRAGRLIARLTSLGREPRLSDPDWCAAVDRIAAELYGVDFFEEV